MRIDRRPVWCYNRTVADLPIVCSLPPGELASRRQALLPGLVRRATRVESVENGWRLVFAPAPGLLRTIAEVIDAERECCRYLRFDIAAEPDRGPIALTVTGPAGTQAMVQDLLA
jgi:hypothetical protein